MKKKLCSLLVALIVLVSCSMPLAYADGTFGELPSESFSADFDNMNAGTNYTDADIQNATGVPMQFATYSASGTPVNASVVEESDGNKFIKLHAVAEGDTIDSLYNLSSPLEVGKLEAGLEFGPAGTGSGRWHLFMIYGQSGEASTISWSNVIAKTENSNIGTVLVQSPTRNDKSRLSLRLEVSRTSNTDDWNVKIYNDAVDPAALVYDGKIPASFGNIYSVKPIRYYGGSGGWPADFDNYFVKTQSYPEVIEDSECQNLAADTESFTIGFNGQLPDPEDAVTLVNTLDENALPITTETSYDAQTGRLTIKPDSLLDYSTTYKIVFANGGVSSFTFATGRAPLRIASSTSSYSNSGGTIQGIPESGTFSVSHTVTARAFAQGKKLVVVLAAYNTEGAALKTNLAQTPLNLGVNGSATATLTDLNAEDVDNIKVFIWEYKDGVGYRPIK